jgi:dolichol-phosphate mannosyltransferase
MHRHQHLDGGKEKIKIGKMAIMLLSVIIPCYNEEAVIAETHRQLTEVMKKLPYEYELIFVNDGSHDNTFGILSDIATLDKHLKVLGFSRNFGHQCAITAGLNYCNGDIAVIIDADLQDPPKVISDMLALMKTENAHGVYAVRRKRAGEPWVRLVAIKIFYRILRWLSDLEIPVDTGDFRMIDRKMIDQFNSLDENNKYIRGLMYWMGFKQIPFYYDREVRFAGKTKYPFRKLLKLALTGVFYFSKKPLDIATSLGFVGIILGFLYASWVLISMLFSDNYRISGWTSTIIMIVFFGGVQLLTIGVLGKYIGNLFDEVKKRPEYIVSEKINFD